MSATGVAWLLLAAACALAIALARELRQRSALRDWLIAPELHPLPDGRGIWGEISSRLLAQHKQQRQRLQELGNALERFRLAVQALPDGVILLDGEMRIEWLNEAACRHFALDATRDPGTQITQLIRLSEFQQLSEHYRVQRRQQPAALLRMDGNGSERVLSVMLVPFSDSGTLLVSTDVTEQVRSEAMRRDFIANVSHELRTPLTVISGFLEQFDTQDPPSGETARTFIRLMAEQAARMNRLINDLLTLSRLESSDRPLREEVVDIPALLAALRDEALALSGQRHEIIIAATSAGKLVGCSEEIRSAFGNLVFNAVRYTPSGGRITLDWRIVDGQPTFAVIDTGIGIPAEHIPRLTERFYRVDKGRATASGGTGLGLAIVKHVLARHGGKLEIRSTPNRGSTFSCRFPAERRV
ncbi:phosphate regulon sensor histidine kinase PhoR [Sulfuricystis multivorans]|uniref:phosphate regulon sensor histidine kinase PhoR n=1 Tax=Sulfuricystis multivorans TaxID=2211108 RepID=UPI000F82D098|nr:phosphate regulon sensor histidine kinase PhoR [Sulfuricystis multivorans]